MKRLLLILFLALILSFIVSCQDKAAMAELEQFKAQAATEEQNKEIVRRLHDEVWSKGNMAVADEIYAADYVAHWNSGADTRGLEAFKKFLLEARGVFSDYTENIEQIVAEGDLVVTRFSDQGTFKGKIIGIPSNGKKVTVQEIAIFRIVNRKVVEQWTIRDSLGLYQQLGMELKPKEGEK